MEDRPRSRGEPRGILSFVTDAESLASPPAAETVDVQGLRVGLLNIDEAAGVIGDWAQERRRRLVVTPNTDHFLRYQTSARFRALYALADLVTVDGSPLGLLARVQGAPRPPRVTGADLFIRCAERAAADGTPFIIIGGGNGVAEDAARRLIAAYPGLQVPLTRSPSAAELSDDRYLKALAQELSDYPTKIVSLCLGSPKQEELFNNLASTLPSLTGVYLCVGAAVDFAAGRVGRAPFLFRRLGVEWIYRLLAEPRRLWRRYLVDDVKIATYFAKAIVGRIRRGGSTSAL